MNVPTLLLALLLVIPSAVLMQAQTPSEHPNYFGTTSPGTNSSPTSSNLPVTKTKEPSDLTALRSHFIADYQAATKPVQERYISDLRALLKRLTHDGNLAGANAVQRELDSSHAAGSVERPVSVRFSGTRWTSADGTSRIEFRPDGGHREQWKEQEYSGSWRPISDTEIALTRSDGNDYRYTVNAEGTKMTRSDGVQWSPTK